MERRIVVERVRQIVQNEQGTYICVHMIMHEIRDDGYEHIN